MEISAMLKKGIWIVLCLYGVMQSSHASDLSLQIGEKFSTESSSQLQSQTHSYSPANLVAPSLKTAWCEGVAGDGVGEWIELRFAKPFLTKSGFVVEILPGYVKTNGLYLENGRPSKLGVSINGTAQEAPIILRDYGKFQAFTLDWAGKGIQTLRLTIGDVYRGTKYSDTCITDIVIRKGTPNKNWSEAESDRETKRILQVFFSGSSGETVKAGKFTIDALDFAMSLSDGMYYGTVEGAEVIKELYLGKV